MVLAVFDVPIELDDVWMIQFWMDLYSARQYVDLVGQCFWNLLVSWVVLIDNLHGLHQVKQYVGWLAIASFDGGSVQRHLEYIRGCASAKPLDDVQILTQLMVVRLVKIGNRSSLSAKPPTALNNIHLLFLNVRFGESTWTILNTIRRIYTRASALKERFIAIRWLLRNLPCLQAVQRTRSTHLQAPCIRELPSDSIWQGPCYPVQHSLQLPSLSIELSS